MSVRKIETAGRILLASPTAVFLAVLTAGFAAASAAQHAGLYRPPTGAAREANVVLACPRTKVANPSKAEAAKCPSSQSKASKAPAAPAAPASATAASAPAPVAANASPEKTASKNGGLSLPLPDFSTPELSRFISPL